MVATATIPWKKTVFRPCLFAPISSPIHLRTADPFEQSAALRAIRLALRDVARFLDRHYLTAKAADFLHRSLRRRMSQAVLAATAGFLGPRFSAIGGAGRLGLSPSSSDFPPGGCRCGQLALCPSSSPTHARTAPFSSRTERRRHSWTTSPGCGAVFTFRK